jgi:hypothetical protein
MNESLARFASGHDDADDQPLTKAARVALEAILTPRFIKMKVDHDGLPIEIPGDIPSSQIELPL